MPSIVTLPWSERPPFTAPLRLSVIVGGRYSTPGCRESKSGTLRVSLGSDWISALSAEFPNEASAVFSVCAAALTSTVTAVAPTFNVKSMVAG